MPYTKHFPKVFSDEEISLVFEFILNKKDYVCGKFNEFFKHRDITAIGLMYYCGLRPAECLQLKWQDIDFEKKLLYIRPYINKRKNDLPAILTKPAESMLQKYRQVYDEAGIKNEWMFPSFWTWQPITTSAFNRIFLDVCKQTGLAKIEYKRWTGQPKYSVSLYCLRHSFATKIYKKTKSEIAVARLCRHTNVESASIYTHLNTEDKIEIANFVFD